MMRFRWIRVLCYIAFFGFFALLPVPSAEDGQTVCMIARLTGCLCPGCGVTRAFTNLMHGDVIRAFMFHPILTVFMAPAAILTSGVDTVCICLRRDSPIDFLWRLLFHRNPMA